MSASMQARLWPVAILIVAMTSIQSGASLATSLFPAIGPTGTTAMRLLIASITLLAVLRPWRRRIHARGWGTIAIYGAALGLMNLLFYQALNRIPLGIAVALEFTGPLAVALLNSRRWLDLCWVAMAISGLIFLLLLGGESGLDVDPVGAAYALGAGVCWALYILFGQKAGTDHGTQTAALGITIAALIFFPIGLAEVGTAMFSPAILPLALGVAVLSTALPYTLEMIAMPKLATHTFGTLMSLEPAVAALSGLVFLGQSLTLIQWLAISMVIAASIGTTLTGQKPVPAVAAG
ncbi:threonine/homoserine exporter RhtA [Onishia niordana]|uniref:threonine/homoserine exporter RhtA n=1 Tax=Onishia niordana TaxID=2508711 RepID=UPI00109F1B4D|nr:threonine/homoserine exporter RhtA [Halomonas niordiana]